MPALFHSYARRATVLLVLSGASLGVAAQIHRCKDESGQLVISDRPCEANPSMQGSQQGSSDAVASRIAAPQMAAVRLRDADAAYAFIPERDGRPTRSAQPAPK
ncbi:DUF4124 domain-containing protein [Variovorax dokdonensis]|uniref:DUF4124 domain-containing protein n=1 Tax=Variovorax dokdonensis TaxID=344883 RepID=A0ABT7NBZ9_9BURK|nr:DUF4124 domain-containing protein [Variovorax dokdonensis]MDM0045453.1 DUF4124 domain-containing protein [Variovorax dokdonensis]